MFLEALEAAPMGGCTLGHLGPTGGRRALFGGSPILRSIFGGPHVIGLAILSLLSQPPQACLEVLKMVDYPWVRGLLENTD